MGKRSKARVPGLSRQGIPILDTASEITARRVAAQPKACSTCNGVGWRPRWYGDDIRGTYDWSECGDCDATGRAVPKLCAQKPRPKLDVYAWMYQERQRTEGK